MREPAASLLVRTLCAGALLCFASSAIAADPKPWKDPSRHTSTLVEVEPNVRLEVLDWGGRGSPLVLLAGLGNTAHVYDEFAQRLTSRHRVIGITRRGFAPSSAPDAGYSSERLAEDIARVLDELKIESPVLVGHSIASEELNAFALRYPTRAAGLVYLDAAYDRTDPEGRLPLMELGRSVPQPDDPTPADLASYKSLARWSEQTSGIRLPEAELRLCCEWAPDGSVKRPAQRSVTAAAQITEGSRKPRYDTLRVPALALFAVARSGKDLPGYRPAFDAAFQTAFTAREPYVRRQIEAFRTGVAGSKVVELPGANHYVFLSNPKDVIRQLEAFLRPSSRR